MKRGFIILIVLLLLAIGGVYYFLKKSNAPVLNGKVNFSISYKDGLELDVYEPTNETYPSRPVLIYYHGGAWVTGDKVTVNNNRFHRAFNDLRSKGYAIVSPEYTLAKYQDSPFPDCIADAFDVITWIEEHASKYNFDTENIGVLGESAGGHLALMVAYANVEKFTKSNAIDLKYVIGIYPPTDLSKLYEELAELKDQVDKRALSMPSSWQDYFDIDQYLFGFSSEEDSLSAVDMARRYSPINYIERNLPATMIVHGDSDRVVPISQSLLLSEKLKTVEDTLEFHPLQGVDHAFANATDIQKEQTQQWIIDFVVDHYFKIK